MWKEKRIMSDAAKIAALEIIADRIQTLAMQLKSHARRKSWAGVNEHRAAIRKECDRIGYTLRIDFEKER
jgi:hypothetical protein